MKKNNQNQKEQQLFGFSSNKIDDIQDTKLNILASQKDDIFQKQNSRKQSGETIFCSDFFGNTLDTQIDTIEEQTPDQFNYNMKDDQLNLQQQKQKTPSNLLSSFRNHQSDKSSIFQRYNSITSQQDNQITNQKLMLDLSQNYFSTRSNKSKQGENNDGNFYPDLNILKKSSSILLKNNLSLNLSNKSLVEQKENKSPVMLTSMGTVKTEKSKNNKNENRNKSGLYKLQRMLNEDKIYFDKKNIETQNPYLSLQISQNGLVRQKNPGIERQNSMLLKKANLIEQQKELSTPKNILNTDQSFSSNASIFKDFSSRSDKVNSKLSLINQSQKQNDNEQQPNQQENLNFNNKSESQQKNQSEQNENLSRLFLFYNNQAKKKKPAEPERFQKRRQNETRIYNEFEPRLKTFTKFGFKMIEKEQNDYLKPFMREFQANQPKGTMYVSDLWADTNILKFLGNCRMIRDKLVLVKLAQKYQSRENLLKQINNSNQLYFSNGSISSQEMYTISSILKKIYSENKQKGNTSGSHTPRTPGKERESILYGQKASILNRKEELNLINNIHMNEVKKQHQKSCDKVLMQPFQSLTSDKNKKLYLEQLQQNLNRRLSKPKSELLTESQYSLQKNIKASYFLKKESLLKQSNYPIVHKQAKSQTFIISKDSQEFQQNNVKFKPLDLMSLRQKQFEGEGSSSKDSRKLSLKNDKSFQIKIKNQQQVKMAEWIAQIDQEIIENDYLYDKLNKHIEKLQDVIIKRNDEYQSDL